MLPAVADLLLEQAVLVADAVAVGGDGERGHAVHVAGGEPAEPAIAERSVRFELAQLVEIDAEVGQCRSRLVQKAQIDQRVEQQASDQKFDRKVIDALGLPAFAALFRIQPAVDDPVADRKDGRQIPVVGPRIRLRFAARIGQLVEDRIAQLDCLGMHRQRQDLRRFWHCAPGIGVGSQHIGATAFGR